MNRNYVIAVFFLVLIVAEGSDASLFWKFRRMAAEGNGGTQVSPSPAPIPEAKSNQHVDLNKTDTIKPQEPQVPDNSSKVVPKNPDVKARNKKVIDENCDATERRCTQKKMIACFKHSENGPQELIVLVQNEGESVLNVNIIVPASVNVSEKKLEIPEHQAKKINASVNVGESPKIILNAGYGDCVLHNGVPISEGNFFQRIPYADRVTPIHGAYFMFVMALMIGGTWACCKLGKKGKNGNGGVPYQELEMALPESGSTNVDAADGWDQGWDDNWDEERAVKSPGHVGNLSANGLTSRSSNRDGWEIDWDD